MEELRIRTVSRAEIKVSAPPCLQEGGRPEILIAALFVDIGPQRAGRFGPGFARQMRAPREEGRGEAAIDPDKQWLVRMIAQPGADLRSRPPAARRGDKARCLLAGLAERNGDPLVARPLRPGPVDRRELAKMGQRRRLRAVQTPIISGSGSRQR